MGELLPSFNVDNRDFSIRTIDFTKAGSSLSDPSNQTPDAIHFSLGVQRELAYGFVVSADAVLKRFVHTLINGIDYNRWNSTGGPVIPACVGSQRTDVTVRCSNRNLFFDTTIGRARYKGLLVRVEKRFARPAQFLASYALGSFVGTNGTGTGTAENTGGRVFGFNNNDWFENYGPLPTDQRHVLNLSGFVELPWRVQVAFSVSAYTAVRRSRRMWRGWTSTVTARRTICCPERQSISSVAGSTSRTSRSWWSSTTRRMRVGAPPLVRSRHL